MNVCGLYCVGKVGVIAGGWERGAAALVSALEAPKTNVVIVDDIGSVELFSASFRKAV